MPNADIINQIRLGDFDHQLDELIAAVRFASRRLKNRKTAENQSTLAPGDRVKILPGIKPKYLTGLTGTISSQHGGRAQDLMFEFDDRSFPYARHRFTRIVGVPANLLERI